MITPELLSPGDTVTIISPSRYAEKEKINGFVDWAKSKGWNVLLSDNLFRQHHQLGGTKEERLNQIKEALEDSTIKAVFCVRGGFGLMDLLPELSELDFKKKPKWWIGFSDVTVLHNILQRQGLVSLHASMPMQFSSNSLMSFESIAEAISTPNNNIKGVDSKLKAPIYGGNLSILYGLSASNMLSIPNDSILFIEEIDEYLYHVDRMMRSLFLAGHISENLKAIAVGYMTDLKDHDVPFGKNANEIIQHYADLANIPVLFRIKSGHEHPNYAIKLGVDVTFVS